MSKAEELKGNNSKNVGSKDYFESLNKDLILLNLIYDKKTTDYDKGIEAIKSFIEGSLKTIKEDLNKQISIIRYIEENKRKDLVNSIEGFKSVLKIVKASNSTADTCISILKLNDRNTNNKSGVSDNDIKRAVKIVKDGGKAKVGSSDRFSLVKKAADYGISSVAGKDNNKLEFLNEVWISKRNEKDFFKDVIYKYTYDYEKDKCKGKCGKIICSTDYIEYYEKNIFGKKFSSSDRNYGKYISNEIISIRDTLMKDIESGKGTQYHIIYDNRERLKKAREAISKYTTFDMLNFLEKIYTMKRLEYFDHKVIELDYTGNDRAIDLSLEWKNNKNILYIKPKVYFDYEEGANNNYFIENGHGDITREQAVFNGMKKWNNTYNSVFYTDDWGGQTVQVICNPVKVDNPKNALRVIMKSEYKGGVSKTKFKRSWGKSRENNATMTLYPAYYNDIKKEYIYSADDIEYIKNFYNIDSYETTVRHEFGHVMGLSDAYTEGKDDDGNRKTITPDYSIYEDIKKDTDNYVPKDIPSDRRGEYIVMNHSNGIITNNDIEMIIQAWREGKAQGYYNEGLIKQSEVIGR